MKNLLIILSLAVAFACHTKEEQKKSGINDPTNMMYGDIDSSVVTFTKKDTTPVAPVTDSVPMVKDTVAACIDSSKIDKKAVCTEQYEPVCGCDNKTYSNKCKAEKAGVLTWKPGKCK